MVSGTSAAADVLYCMLETWERVILVRDLRLLTSLLKGYPIIVTGDLVIRQFVISFTWLITHSFDGFCKETRFYLHCLLLQWIFCTVVVWYASMWLIHIATPPSKCLLQIWLEKRFVELFVISLTLQRHLWLLRRLSFSSCLSDTIK